MWSPTHVQVTVQRARGLLTKGKHGTNDAFVTIALAKEKYQTSVKEKALQDVEWHEECELQIPKQGNVAEIILTVLHRNFIGVDEFLGVVNIPLADFDVYERPRNRWYELKSKPGKEKNKSRGELEVRVSFLVKAGSLTDLSKKHRSSLGQLSQMAQSVGGSLLSLGTIEKRKGIKKLAESLVRKSKKNDVDIAANHGFRTSYPMSSQIPGDADPGVISEGDSEDDFTLDDLSHKSSGSSLNASQPPVTPVIGSLENLAGGEFLRRTSTLQIPRSSGGSTQARPSDEWEQKLYGKQGKDALSIGTEIPKRRSWESSKTVLSSQPEEDEADENIKANKFSISGQSDSCLDHPTPAAGVPQVAAHRGQEKVKEGSRLVRKLKQFRKVGNVWIVIVRG
ncbi:rab11 family-interacting protein 1 [Cryptotermes secundus]|uniref:rab11 family-interacting protein 1 n=1 Tax=Cryptotermes secundus TaxID=105785 RepID=UPI000CD7ADA3|nr:rab11 family-interacting protein 1 [Cryptotermes secundus]